MLENTGNAGDIVDMSVIEQRIFIDVALSNLRNSQTIERTGFCLYCDEPLHDNRRWCDADCRDDWEKLNKLG